jgi:tRNA(Ile2) C34 agmatinyltransferase TiaS
MSRMRTVDDAFGPTLDEVLVAALRRAARPARSAICPVCDGSMRSLSDGGGALTCGECGSSIEDAESAQDQLRLVA